MTGYLIIEIIHSFDQERVLFYERKLLPQYINKLLKLISVTNGDLLLSSEKINQLHTKLNIADSNFELSYALADTLILGKTKWYNDPEDGFEIELELSTEDVDHLIKAKNVCFCLISQWAASNIEGPLLA